MSLILDSFLTYFWVVFFFFGHYEDKTGLELTKISLPLLPSAGINGTTTELLSSPCSYGFIVIY